MFVHGVEALSLRSRNEIVDGPTDDVIERGMYDFRESLVAVEDGAVGADGNGAFLHSLHEDTIRVVGASQREYPLRAGRAGDNDCIYLSITNRSEGFFGSI